MKDVEKLIKKNSIEFHTKYSNRYRDYLIKKPILRKDYKLRGNMTILRVYNNLQNKEFDISDETFIKYWLTTETPFSFHDSEKYIITAYFFDTKEFWDKFLLNSHFKKIVL